MLYSEYSKKMTKVAAVVNRIRRYKILIISVFAVILAIAATLLATRGIVYDSSECPSEITYGTEFSYRAGAFLNDVEYEFRAVGSDVWTSEQPVRAGRYYVRAVSTRTFGAKSYGKVYEFSIVPKPTEITVANSVLFGEIPEYSAELAYGDTLTVSDFNYADLSKTSTLVKADISSAIVIDERGDDVTSSYSFVSEYSDISFVPREIELTVESVSGVYDGEPLTSSAWELTGGSLAAGDGIVTVFDKSQTNVGSTENTPVITVTRAVLNSDGVDVTANYKITQKVGTLTVEKREIVVNTADASHVYDDTAFSCSEFELADGYSLVGSDRLVAAVSQTITDVGEIENKILFEVYDSSGEDVTYNYSIVISAGTLSVTKREVNVVSADAQKTYDGTPLKNDGYRLVDTLAAGHTLSVTSDTEITDAGTALNALAGVVYGVDGVTDCSDNYEIIWQYGTLTVSKRKIKVQTPSYEWIYDGKSHSYTNGFGVIENVGSEYCDSLVSGHVLHVERFAEITNVAFDGDSVSGVDNVIEFKVMSGDKDYSDNYEIEVVAGTLKILRRDITVESATAEWVYDGKSHSDGGVKIVVGSLADGQKIFTDNLTEVDAVIFDGDEISVKNNDLDVSILSADGTEDLTVNYKIELKAGTLKILKRNIVIAAQSKEKIYDGSALTCNEYGIAVSEDPKAYALVEGHDISLSFTANSTITDAGDADNEIMFESVVISSGETDVTRNYAVAVKSGTLTVKKRPVKVTTESAEKVYDGEPLFGSSATVEEFDGEAERGVLIGHTYKTSSTVGITEVSESGTKNAVYITEIADANGMDVTANYEMEYEFGTLTVKKRPVKVTTESAEKVYDGTPLFGSSATVEEFDGEAERGILIGHTYKTSSTVGITEVSESGTKNAVYITEIADANDKDVTANYEMEYEFGTLTVNKRPVTVTTNSNTWVYDGEVKSDRGFEITDGELVDGHSSRCFVYYPILTPNVITQENKMDIVISDSRNVDKTANYDITYVYGTLSITKRPVSLKTESKTWIYDGTEKSYAVVSDISVGENTGILSGFTLGTTAVTFITEVMYDENGNVSGVKNDVKLGAVYDSNNSDIDRDHNKPAYYADNYEFTIESYGTIAVTPRPITVRAAETTRMFNGVMQYSDFEITSFYDVVDGQTGEAEFKEGFIYVGTHYSVVSAFRVYLGSSDKSSNYYITIDDTPAEFVITKRPITLCSMSTEEDDRYIFGDYWYYDGTAKYLEVRGWKGEYGLCVSDNGSLLHEMVGDNYARITEAGSCENTFTAKIVDVRGPEPGKDVTDNYDITYEYGTLIVLPRSIIVQAGSAEKIYDGTPLVYHEYDISSSDDPKAFELVAGHEISLTFTADSVITYVGSTPNKIERSGITIRADGSDVTRNYDITVKDGTLTICKRPVKVVTKSGSKVYDGEILNAVGSTVEYTDGYSDRGILLGHMVYSSGPFVGITDVSESGTLNKFTIQVFEGNVDVTENYDVEYEYGTLTIEPRLITVITATNEWDYDGVEHFDNRFEIIEGVLVDGHEMFVDDYTVIVDPSTVDNVLTFAVYANGVDKTGNYDIVQQLGTLTVIAPDEPDDPPAQEFPILNVKSDISGTLYFKIGGYGEYTGTTDWGSFDPYDGQSINYNGHNYSVNYLTSVALKSAGLSAFSTEIEVLHSQFLSVLPYYTTLESGPYYDGDISYTGTETQYSVMQYYYNYTDDNGALLASSSLGIFTVVEKAYRSFVYETYLDVPDSTAEYMRGVISARKLDAADPEIISKVAKYIQSSATYNLNYDTALDAAGDVAVAFLETYKEGVCRHYATAATLLFRTLGIPARYVTGAICSAEAGEWVEVSSGNAHAWVEVYIDGAGWVNIEVTGGGFGGGGNGDGDGDNGDGTGGSGEGEVKPIIVVKPLDIETEYTGAEIFAEQKVEDGTGGETLISELVKAGYTYTVTVIGSRTDYGTSESIITEFSLFDPSGENVTDKFIVNYETGIIRITKTQIVVYMPTYSKEYDGEPLVFVELMPNEYGYYWDALPAGVADLIIDMTLFEGIVEPSSMNSMALAVKFEELDAFTVISIGGTDVTDNYTVVFASGGLTVEKRSIRLTAGSSEKKYDGEELTCDDFVFSLGTLAAGHSIEVTLRGAITDIGEVNNVISKYVITDENGDDVTAYYKVSIVNGLLKID